MDKNKESYPEHKDLINTLEELTKELDESKSDDANCIKSRITIIAVKEEDSKSS